MNIIGPVELEPRFFLLTKQPQWIYDNAILKFFLQMLDKRILLLANQNLIIEQRTEFPGPFQVTRADLACVRDY